MLTWVISLETKFPFLHFSRRSAAPTTLRATSSVRLFRVSPRWGGESSSCQRGERQDSTQLPTTTTRYYAAQLSWNWTIGGKPIARTQMKCCVLLSRLLPWRLRFQWTNWAWRSNGRTPLTRGRFLVGKFHSPSHHCPTKRSASFSTLELSTQGKLRDFET